MNCLYRNKKTRNNDNYLNSDNYRNKDICISIYKRYGILIFILTVIIAPTNSQDRNTTTNDVTLKVPSISLVDFAGSEKSVSYGTGSGAQQIITPSTLNKTWLNYSCISDGKSTNAISVNLSNDELPAEVQIKLTVGDDVGAGAGKLGTPVGTIILTPYPQDIVIGIGSCYTGKGPNKGHQLSYSWEYVDGVDESDIESLKIGVLYTITTTK